MSLEIVRNLDNTQNRESGTSGDDLRASLPVFAQEYMTITAGNDMERASAEAQKREHYMKDLVEPAARSYIRARRAEGVGDEEIKDALFGIVKNAEPSTYAVVGPSGKEPHDIFEEFRIALEASVAAFLEQRESDTLEPEARDGENDLAA